MSDRPAVHRGEEGVVLIKVDPNLEGGGEAAGGGMSRGRSGGGPEVTTDS